MLYIEICKFLYFTCKLCIIISCKFYVKTINTLPLSHHIIKTLYTNRNIFINDPSLIFGNYPYKIFIDVDNGFKNKNILFNFFFDKSSS